MILQDTITSFSYLQGLAEALNNCEGTNDLVTVEQAENLIKNKQMTVIAQPPFSQNNTPQNNIFNEITQLTEIYEL